MDFHNASIERIKHGKEPRDPMTNDDRLRLFRTRMASLCVTEFNTVFIAGKVQEATRAQR